MQGRSTSIAAFSGLDWWLPFAIIEIVVEKGWAGYTVWWVIFGDANFRKFKESPQN